MTADKSTCRFNGIFYTDYRYNQIHIGESNIIVSLD